MPPLSGFVGKLLIMDAARGSDLVWWIWAVILSTSLIAMVGFARAGTTVFWKTTPAPVTAEDAAASRDLLTAGPSALPFVAVGGLIAALALTTILAGPLTVYLNATADQLYSSDAYIRAVLGGE
jgi:multicomponent K+:H+ antiporter subunit D